MPALLLCDGNKPSEQAGRGAPLSMQLQCLAQTSLQVVPAQGLKMSRAPWSQPRLARRWLWVRKSRWGSQSALVQRLY